MGTIMHLTPTGHHLFFQSIPRTLQVPQPCANRSDQSDEGTSGAPGRLRVYNLPKWGFPKMVGTHNHPF